MKVIKLGGSLSQSASLMRCMEAINRDQADQMQVVVPGGGAFADQVRLAQQQWSFNDVAAHNMAILAMRQMALMFEALQPEWRLYQNVAVLQGKLSNGVAIWSPEISELDLAGVPASWDITSDSLAAWLAMQLQADELILVKSIAIDASESLDELQRRGVIDSGFHLFSEQADFTIRVQNQQQFSCIQ